MFLGADPKPANGVDQSRNGGASNAAAEVKGERHAVFLHPGRIFVSAEPSTVRMILGSCVAVCLWDPLRRVGGANHYLLPYQGSDSAEFGDVAIQRLIEQLLALGCSRTSITAKLFGGSCVLEALQSKDTHVGTRNVALARTLLASHGIPIVAHDVGGKQGRRVIFQTDDGCAWVRHL
jgi:chemotaxis protein CheD